MIERGLRYLVGIQGTHLVGRRAVARSATDSGARGATRTHHHDGQARAHADRYAGQDSGVPKGYMARGARGRQTSRFAAARIRSAEMHHCRAPPGEPEWLLCEWPEGESERGFLSNRMPNKSEQLSGRPVLKAFLELFPCEQIVALGKIAAAQFEQLGFNAHCVRHPASGGAKLFRQQIAKIAAKSSSSAAVAVFGPGRAICSFELDPRVRCAMISNADQPAEKGARLYPV